MASPRAGWTLSLPPIRGGIERLRLPTDIWEYLDEHVEADAVHEQVALHDICGRLVHDEPELQPNVVLGATVCQQLGARSADRVLEVWGTGRSCLVPTDDSVPA